jgi:hypothetical protein
MLIKIEKIDEEAYNRFPVSNVIKNLDVTNSIKNEKLYSTVHTEGYVSLLNLNLPILNKGKYPLTDNIRCSHKSLYKNIDDDKSLSIATISLMIEFLNNRNNNSGIPAIKFTSNKEKLPIFNNFENDIKKYLHSPLVDKQRIEYKTRFHINPKNILDYFLSVGIKQSFSNTLASTMLIGNGIIQYIPKDHDFLPICYLEVKKEYVPYVRLAYILEKPMNVDMFKLNIIDVDSFDDYTINQVKKIINKVTSLGFKNIEKKSFDDMTKFVKKTVQYPKVKFNKELNFRKLLVSTYAENLKTLHIATNKYDNFVNGTQDLPF